MLSTSEILYLAKRFTVKSTPTLATAIALVESSGNPLAIRYEAHFRWTLPASLRPSGCSVDTEQILQQSSLGLMQIMGANARSLGFSGWLTELLLPEVGMMWGCRWLDGLGSKYHVMLDVISAYNAGSPRKEGGEYVNQSYVDKVRSALREVDGESI